MNILPRELKIEFHTRLALLILILGLSALMMVPLVLWVRTGNIKSNLPMKEATIKNVDSDKGIKCSLCGLYKKDSEAAHEDNYYHLLNQNTDTYICQNCIVTLRSLVKDTVNPVNPMDVIQRQYQRDNARLHR